jgi:hypothetical protein
MLRTAEHLMANRWNSLFIDVYVKQALTGRRHIEYDYSISIFSATTEYPMCSEIVNDEARLLFLHITSLPNQMGYAVST